MKEIKAIIQPFMLEAVLQRLETLELPGLTISEVRGWGRSAGGAESSEKKEIGHRFATKTKLEIVVSPELLDPVITAIAEAARTGRAGDGKVYVTEIDRAVRIRTGEDEAVGGH